MVLFKKKKVMNLRLGTRVRLKIPGSCSATRLPVGTVRPE